MVAAACTALNCTAPVPQESGACTWFLAAGMCVVGCWPCAFLPFCLNSTKDTGEAFGGCEANAAQRVLHGPHDGAG